MTLHIQPSSNWQIHTKHTEGWHFLWNPHWEVDGKDQTYKTKTTAITDDTDKTVFTIEDNVTTKGDKLPGANSLVIRDRGGDVIFSFDPNDAQATAVPIVTSGNSAYASYASVDANKSDVISNNGFNCTKLESSRSILLTDKGSQQQIGLSINSLIDGCNFPPSPRPTATSVAAPGPTGTPRNGKITLQLYSPTADGKASAFLDTKSGIPSFADTKGQGLAAIQGNPIVLDYDQQAYGKGLYND